MNIYLVRVNNYIEQQKFRGEPPDPHTLYNHYADVKTEV